MSTLEELSFPHPPEGHTLNMPVTLRHGTEFGPLLGAQNLQWIIVPTIDVQSTCRRIIVLTQKQQRK